MHITLLHIVGVGKGTTGSALIGSLQLLCCLTCFCLGGTPVNLRLYSQKCQDVPCSPICPNSLLLQRPHQCWPHLSATNGLVASSSCVFYANFELRVRNHTGVWETNTPFLQTNNNKPNQYTYTYTKHKHSFPRAFALQRGSGSSSLAPDLALWKLMMIALSRIAILMTA